MGHFLPKGAGDVGRVRDRLVPERWGEQLGRIAVTHPRFDDSNGMTSDQYGQMHSSHLAVRVPVPRLLCEMQA